jgi:hypothetical protein
MVQIISAELGRTHVDFQKFLGFFLSDIFVNRMGTERIFRFRIFPGIT